MIRLSVGVDGITVCLPTGDQVTIDADQAQNLGNELLNCATATRIAKVDALIAKSMAAHPSNRTTQTSETP